MLLQVVILLLKVQSLAYLKRNILWFYFVNSFLRATVDWFNCHKLNLRDIILGFPGGLVVKNWPPNAGGVGSIPGDRTEIPHEGQLSPEPQLLSLNTLEPVLRSKRSLSNTVRQKKKDCTPLQRPCTAEKPSTAKKKKHHMSCGSICQLEMQLCPLIIHNLEQIENNHNISEKCKSKLQ